MKNYLITTFMSTIFLMISIFGTVHAQETGIAPNVSFTDLGGTSHTLYTYLDSGYTVILDFSYEFCGACADWSANVGHDLWAEHGPDGDNTLRMFHFDVDPVTDEVVQEYTEEWGVECPVVNLEDNLPEYPSNAYPNIIFACPDKSYETSTGYGFPSSQIEADVYLEQCQGNDISTSINFLSTSPALSNSLCNSSPLNYTPKLHIVNNASVSSSDESSWIDTNYQIEIFKNGTYFATQDVDPWSDNTLDFEDTPTLNPIPVANNDVLTLVCHYPLDNYANDDTVFVTIPSEVNTPTSSDTSLIVNLTEGLYFNIKNPEGEYIELEENQTEFTLAVDSCYSIQFINSHVYSGTLKDANGLTLVSYEVGDFEGYETPWLYFHVSDTATVNDTTTAILDFEASKRLLRVDYFDMLGRSHTKSNLPKGIYFEHRYYSNGQSQVKKYYKKK